MGIKGLFSYVRQEIPGAIKDLSLEDILNEIREAKK
jgi:hypothetical protein